MKITHFKNEIIIAFILGIGASLLNFVFTIISGYLLSRTVLNDKMLIIFCFSIFILSTIIFNYLSEMKFKSINTTVHYFYLSQAWKKLLHIPYATIKKIHSTELYKLLHDYESALSAVTFHIFSALNNIFLILLLFACLFYCHTALAVVYLAVLTFSIAVKIISLQILSAHSLNHLNAQNRADIFLNEALGQIHIIKTANIENLLQKKWLTLLIQAKNLLISSIKLETKLCVLDMLIITTLLLTSLYCRVTVTFLACASQLLLTYQTLSTQLLTLTNLRIAIIRLTPLLSSAPEKQPSLTLALPNITKISLINVSTNKLNNITIEIKAGSFIALIGASGSGKSTLFKLIMGLEMDYTGTILLDGHDMKELDMHLVRQQFGVVLQTSNLFPGTIFSNIAVNTNITLDEAWQLACLVGLDGEINTMPMKMFTYISDNPGDSISGGQKQKILIARALATKPKILLLDEATSGLDPASQLVIFNNLQRLNITLFVIAHHLNSIEKADKIYYLQNGHVIIVNKH